MNKIIKILDDRIKELSDEWADQEENDGIADQSVRDRYYESVFLRNKVRAEIERL
jgi:hypothetical protein